LRQPQRYQTWRRCRGTQLEFYHFSMYIYDKLFYTLAYPFACLVALYVVLLFLRWSSIYWCEQMREVLEVNREGMIPLHSLPGLDFLLFGLFPRAMAHVLFWPLVYYQLLLNPCTYFYIGILVCLFPRWVFWIIIWSDVILRILAAYIIYVTCHLIRIFI